jgi:hypothetical protein
MMGLAVVLASVVIAAMAPWTPDPRTRIKVGMTKEEVASVTGTNPSNSISNVDVCDVYYVEPRLWSNSYTVYVLFRGPPGKPLRVIGVNRVKYPDNRTWFERLQDEYSYDKHRFGW